VPPAQAASILSLQGVKMGRPSRVHVAIGLENGDISRVQVGGEAVLVGEGELYL
jgi:predicted PhzF superfamily epimerase YddE/YHI9